VQAGWTDLDGNPRLSNGQVSIGCYEVAASTPPPNRYGIFCVSPTGSDANDGHDWAHATQTIGAALALAARTAAARCGCRAAPRPGCVYHENVLLQPYVALYGGFAGTEDPTTPTASLALRDWTTNLTIIDGGQQGHGGHGGR